MDRGRKPRYPAPGSAVSWERQGSLCVVTGNTRGPRPAMDSLGALSGRGRWTEQAQLWTEQQLLALSQASAPEELVWELHSGTGMWGL